MAGIITFPLELLDNQDVLQPDHLIQEKIEPDYTHLPTHSTKLTKPVITLLSHGCVEEPTLHGPHLWKIGGIAIFLAELVRNSVLVEKVPHIDDKSNVVKEWITRLEYLL